MNVPAMAASIVAILVFGFIAIFTFMARGPEARRTTADPAVGTSGPVSPFAQPPANTPLPQPSRTPGVDLNRPRIATRTAPPPDPGVDTGGSTVTAPQAVALPPAGDQAQAAPMESALPPAPVDASPLQRFPEPVRTAQPPPQQPTRPPAQPYTQPANPPGVVAAPPAQPGGTIFGQSPGTSPRATSPNTTNNPFSAGGMESTVPTPAPAAPRQAPASPAQSFVERDYGGAIHSLSQRIAAGQATGSNYQQLGAAYANVGDRGQAIAAYRNAEAAFRAQIQAGQDVEVAQRGLRNTQLQLQMLGAR